MELERVSNLTVGELRVIIQDIVSEALLEILGVDPDAGRMLKPEIAERLRASMRARQSGEPRDLISQDELRRELGLES